MKNIVRDCFIERKKAFMYIMLQKWTNFDVDWKRRSDNDKILFEVSKFIYFVWIIYFMWIHLNSWHATSSLWTTLMLELDDEWFLLND
jgi:hypothetical protein